jgi:hypothetical protein
LISRSAAIPILAGRVAALIPGVIVLAAGVADGGFFPTAWGWLAIALSALAGISLLLRERIVLGRLEWGALAALAAFVAWSALSMAWSAALPQSLREAERGLIYAAGLLAVLVGVQRRARPALLAGLCAAICAISAYGLATRLFPSKPIVVDPFEGTTLIEPLGYANALGLLAAIGVLLALTFAAVARAPFLRALAAGSPMLLLPVLYLTESRGAWLALAGGLAVALSLDPRRLRSLALIVAISPMVALALWLTAHARALREPQASLAAVGHAGHRLALSLALLAFAAAGTGLAIERIQAALCGRRMTLLAAAALLAGALAFLAIRSVSEPRFAGDRPAYWRVAWSESNAHPWLGSGAGTFALYWQHARPLPVDVQDAHNLYLETLAELGPLGLASLLSALLLPLWAAVSARSQQLAAGAVGAYVAFLIHAGLDWDWEMPAVTLVALFCAAGGLIAARPERGSPPLPPVLRLCLLGTAVGLAALALAGLLDNSGRL